MTFSEYIKSLKDKTVALLGIGVSNRPLIDILCDSGAKVIVCDKKNRDELGDIVNNLTDKGVTLRLGEGYLDNLFADVLFRSPGMRPDLPALERVRELGGVVTSELEVFFDLCPCPIIAVTGSDGKTTTTTLIYTLLTQAGYTCHLGGNIGHPLLADTPNIKPTDFAVVELSSFQLMTMKKSPDIAVITNLSPNHLDMHRGMEEYVSAKKNIFLNQSKDNRVVLNADNDITAGFVSETVGKTVVFSKMDSGADGVYCRNGEIIVRENGNETVIMATADIRIPGIHNVENYMAAIGAVWGLVGVEHIVEVAKTFSGVEHRCELVRELDEVRYYNDSIATSPTRVIAGLRAFDRKVILIAGGYDKHIPFDVLGPEIIKHVKALVLCGATAEKIRKCVTDCPEYNEKTLPIVEFDDFTKAVSYTREIATAGDIVTLSPACAAFDQFKNFAQRGQRYKEIVNEF